MFEVGTVCWVVVGAPGPQYELCVISGYVGTAYKIKLKVFGLGSWIEDTVKVVFPVTEGADNPEYLEYLELGKRLAQEYYN